MTMVGRWLVMALWLVSAMFGFWFFQLRDERVFESGVLTAFDPGERAVSAEAWYRSALPTVEQPGSAPIATVVDIYRPGCACNRFTQPHLDQIMALYRKSGVRFIVASRQDLAASDAPADRSSHLIIPDERELDWLSSTPAALVYNRAGKLVYFGPYSTAAWCGASGGVVERVLDRLLAGQVPRLQPFYGSGCFCPTQPQALHG